MRWKWFARGEDQPLDLIGPATRYTSRRGAYAPSWTAPTDPLPFISDAPLLRGRAEALNAQDEG
jgi:hypothetical protein